MVPLTRYAGPCSLEMVNRPGESPKPRAKAAAGAQAQAGLFLGCDQPFGRPAARPTRPGSPLSMLWRKTFHPRFQRLDRSAYGDAQPGYLIDYYHPV